MAANTVSRLHINFLLTAGLTFPDHRLEWQTRRLTAQEWATRAEDVFRTLTPQTAGSVGAMLLAQNARSINHRHQVSDWEEPYLFTRTNDPNPVATLVAISFYESHASADPEWDGSEAFYFCHALRKTAATRLDRYHEFPWGIDDEEDLLECLSRD